MKAATSFPITFKPYEKPAEDDDQKDILLDMSILDQSSASRDFILAKNLFWKGHKKFRILSLTPNQMAIKTEEISALKWELPQYNGGSS